MDVFRSHFIEDVILVTAIINIIGVALVFFSCRFIPQARMTNKLMNQKWFKSLYRYHTYIWWVVGPSILVHAVIAILHRLAGG